MIDVNTTTTIAPATAWGFTIESLAKDTDHLPIEAQRLLQDCVQWAMQHGISRAEFAESLGTTDNTLYKICTGRQLDPSKGTKLQLSSRIYGNLQRWIASRKKVRGAAMLPAFVETQTAAKVFYACDLARESRTTVWLYGPTHCGKSTALREYAAQHGRSVRYVEFLAATGPIDMLREICGACCIQFGRAALAGEVAQMEAVVVIAPAQGGLALVDVAQLALALGFDGTHVGVGGEGSAGGRGHAALRSMPSSSETTAPVST